MLFSLSHGGQFISIVFIQQLLSSFANEDVATCRSLAISKFLLDLRNANINNSEFDKIPESKRPDVVLIKRYTDPAAKRRRKHRRRRRRVLSTGESVMETVTIATEDVATVDLSTIDGTETLGVVDDEEVEDDEDFDFSDDEYSDAQEELPDAQEAMETE
ncbi:hypothetical protein ACTXT7_006537 [Hymenolepis weldensis]